LAERQPEAYKKLQEQYATVLAAREALEKTAAGGDPLEPSPEAHKAITELAEKFDNLGKTAREIELGKIEELGATPEQLRIADQLLRQIDLTERANKTWKEMREAAQKAIEDNQTPMEQFQASMQDLNKLLDYGLLSWEQYARARQKAFEGATGMKQTPFGAPLLRAGTQEAITAERRHEFGSEIEAANERMINQIAEQLEVQRRQLQVQEETRDGIKAWKQAEPIDL